MLETEFVIRLQIQNELSVNPVLSSFWLEALRKGADVSKNKNAT